ncbi:MAG: hypothetical protein Kow00109_10610 [Acidobacteriota bacterium]
MMAAGTLIETALRRSALLGIVVVGAVALLYLPAFPGAFHFDDYAFLWDNPRLDEPGIAADLLLEFYGGRPLTMLSFLAQQAAGATSAAPFLAVNLLLHLAAVALLFAALLRWDGDARVAFLAALWFGVHPVQTQAVEYIWSRSVPAAFVFGLAAFLLAQRPLRALGGWQIAVLWRADALLWAGPLVRANRRCLKPILFLGGLNVFWLAYGAWLNGTQGFVLPLREWPQYWAEVPAAYLQNLAMLVWPVGQSLAHPPPPSGLVWFLGGTGVLLSLFLIAERASEGRPWLKMGVTGLHWFLLPILLVPNPYHVHESRLYPAVACAAWIWGRIAVGLWDYVRARRFGWPGSGGALLAAALWLAGFAHGTWQRHAIWKDDVALWREAAARDPADFAVHYNLGVAYSRAGRFAEAEEAFRRALRLNPADDLSYAGLAYCREMQGDEGGAAYLYEMALRLAPENLFARSGRLRTKCRVPRQTDPERRNVP